jgi:hypothetical protein
MLFSIFSKITRRELLTEKIKSSDDDIYLYILFPITVAFLITFIGSRIISHMDPNFFLHIVPGLHIHHFAYGIILLAASGYLALINEGPRARYLIALLHGFALGLAFDEFGIWLRLSATSTARFSYDGVVVLIAFFILLLSAESGSRMWQRHLGPKIVKKETVVVEETTVSEPPVTP